MLVGLGGLAAMAMPGLSRHGHGGGHGRLMGPRGGHAPGAHLPRGGRMAKGAHVAGDAASGLLRFAPEPRALLSTLALYGAFGNLLERGAHLSTGASAVLAVPAALAVELALVRP